jgi:hypothetical protein
MKSRYLLLLIISFLFIQPIFAQDADQKISKCDCTECHQFDFWIGKWKVKWTNSDGSKSEGTNTVNLILDGCVIEENFDGNPAMPFRGKSVSVYNNTQKFWQQIKWFCLGLLNQVMGWLYSGWSFIILRKILLNGIGNLLRTTVTTGF